MTTRISAARDIDEPDTYWLLESFVTSDGPRVRVIGPRRDKAEDEIREEVKLRQRSIDARNHNPSYERGYKAGERDGVSRARNRPGDGDMGG